MRGENRETSWVIRAALHDMMSDDFLHLATAESRFCRFICENTLEDSDFNASVASKNLNVSVKTLRKYAKEFISKNEGSVVGLKESKDKKKRKKRWWEA